jgi:putative ABC transport system ATP-binding protein
VCVAALSGGERQSLVLAMCLLHPPELLLLDEHTSALDPKIAANLINYTERLLEEKRITCVLTTHNLDIALKYGNRLLALAEGQIRLQADGPDKARLTQEEVLERCYL